MHADIDPDWSLLLPEFALCFEFQLGGCQSKHIFSPTQEPLARGIVDVRLLSPTNCQLTRATGDFVLYLSSVEAFKSCLLTARFVSIVWF